MRVAVPVGAISIETPVRRVAGEAFDPAEMRAISEFARRRGNWPPSRRRAVAAGGGLYRHRPLGHGRAVRYGLCVAVEIPERGERGDPRRAPRAHRRPLPPAPDVRRRPAACLALCRGRAPFPRRVRRALRPGGGGRRAIFRGAGRASQGHDRSPHRRDQCYGSPDQRRDGGEFAGASPRAWHRDPPAAAGIADRRRIHPPHQRDDPAPPARRDPRWLCRRARPRVPERPSFRERSRHDPPFRRPAPLDQHDGRVRIQPPPAARMAGALRAHGDEQRQQDAVLAAARRGCRLSGKAARHRPGRGHLPAADFGEPLRR